MSESINKTFDEVYKRNIDTVYTVSFLHLKNRSDAEDAAQTVFMKYLTSCPVFENPEHEKSWFVLTARNYCRNLLKHWWNRRRADSDCGEAAVPSFACESDGDMTEALMKLPEKYRELIYLYYYEEYSVREISEITGKKESTLRTQIQRARERLKKQLEKEGIHSERDKIVSDV